MSGRKSLLEVLSGKVPERRPVWFMRQAGRYLPEYRNVRQQAGSFLELCYNPELACEVTLQPLRRYDLDAAILFADILVIPHAMGLELRFEEGEGPRLETVASLEGVRGLRAVAASDQVKRVSETVSRVRRSLDGGVPLIGFCGGPWTVASYMIEGGSSDRLIAKQAALARFDWFEGLIDRLVEESVSYLSAQIEAGAEVVKIFDSWAGELTGETGDRYVVRPLQRMCAALKLKYPDVPVIVFARGFGVRQLAVAESTGAAGLAIEAELPMSWAAEQLAAGVAIQGNLDPVALLSGADVARRETEAVVRSIAMNRHIFNLGHGIRQGTDPSVLTAVIDAVRAWDRQASHG